MSVTSTGADAKAGKWILRRYEDDFLRPFLLKLVPRFIETYHLTLMTILWSIGAVVFSYLAQSDIRWLWLVSLMLALQYLTDFLDGAVGRARNTGLVKWGYCMDYFLDYIFFTALILGYSFIFPASTIHYVIFISLIQIGFMVNMFLSFAMTNAFSISFASIGPTEVRILYVIFNTYLIFFGLELPVMLIPYFAVLMVGALAVFVYKTQKTMWKIDMENKYKA